MITFLCMLGNINKLVFNHLSTTECLLSEGRRSNSNLDYNEKMFAIKNQAENKGRSSSASCRLNTNILQCFCHLAWSMC